MAATAALAVNGSADRLDATVICLLSLVGAMVAIHIAFNFTARLVVDLGLLTLVILALLTLVVSVAIAIAVAALFAVVVVRGRRDDKGKPQDERDDHPRSQIAEKCRPVHVHEEPPRPMVVTRSVK
jgi:hypothetical protein